jgi:hypothetical protein
VKENDQPRIDTGARFARAHESFLFPFLFSVRVSEKRGDERRRRRATDAHGRALRARDTNRFLVKRTSRLHSTK